MIEGAGKSSREGSGTLEGKEGSEGGGRVRLRGDDALRVASCIVLKQSARNAQGSWNLRSAPRRQGYCLSDCASPEWRGVVCCCCRPPSRRAWSRRRAASSRMLVLWARVPLLVAALPRRSPPLLLLLQHGPRVPLPLTPPPLLPRCPPLAMALPASSAPLPAPPRSHHQLKLGRSHTGALELDGFSIEGVSVGGQETCILLPALKLAFDIGRCPERAVSQDFLFISHAHMDHIGGICMYVATRGLFKMKPPTVIVPKCLKATVEKLFDVHRELDGSELEHQLIGLDIGEEFNMGKNLIVKAFKTYHVVPSQGYVVYSVKNKLKSEYLGLPGQKIKELKMSGVQITDTVRVSEVAFTGDTTPDFILDDANTDALQAKLLIMETTFLDDAVTIEHAREYGHTHLFEVLKYADRLHNKSILFIHFSARYKREEILKAVEELPPPLQGRVAALTEGF